MLTIRHDSTQIERLVTANDNPSYRMEMDIQYDGSSFVVTSRSIQVESCRFDIIYNPPSQTLAEYFLSVLQIDIRYDVSFDSSRFDNIFNPLWQTLEEYFLSLLQIDFRYAFPCFKRWLLRTPVSQHHLAANRIPV